ncbi:hypothetical protein ACFQE1_08300, partial [Halobium palmae]
MSGRISRQLTVLVVALLLTPAGYVALAPGGSASAQAVSEFSVSQGSQCTTVSPLGDGSQTVSDYYDYRTPPDGMYASYGTTDVQRTATSNLYLYDGSGGVSLVMLHDELNDGEGGGTITFDVSGGPAGDESNWAVKDDAYGNTTDDDFEHDSSGTHIEWVWSTGRTDGAALTGVGDTDETITIVPDFNEDSDRWDSWDYTGDGNRTTTWRLLSGDGESTPLDMDQEVEISAGACPSDLTPTTNPPITSTTTATTAEPTTTTSTTTETTTETTTTQTPTETTTETTTQTPTETTTQTPTETTTETTTQTPTETTTSTTTETTTSPAPTTSTTTEEPTTETPTETTTETPTETTTSPVPTTSTTTETTTETPTETTTSPAPTTSTTTQTPTETTTSTTTETTTSPATTTSTTTEEPTTETTTETTTSTTETTDEDGDDGDGGNDGGDDRNAGGGGGGGG